METRNKSILIVDDEEDLCEILQYNLGNEGYTTEVVHSAEEALKRPLAGFDLILLDVMMGPMSGFRLADKLRKEMGISVPIIFLTAKDTENDILTGFSLGADDYIAKPFEPRELLARIKSVLRRMVPLAAGAAGAETTTPSSAGFARNEAMVAVGECRLDLRAHRLFDAAGEELMLTAMEFELLKAFVERPNQVLSRDQLLTLTRNREWEPFDRSIDIRIARLRRKVEPDPERPRLIRTVRSAGYMYVPA